MTIQLLRRIAAPAAFLLAAACNTAFGGQPCAEQASTIEGKARSAQLSGQLRTLLEKQEHSLVLVARAGANLTEFGLHFSHVGVAWRDHPSGRWFTFHLLNRCGTGQSDLLEQSLEDFFNVELHAYEALVSAPSFPVQVKLQRAFFGPMAKALHEPEYNMISHPYSTKYQNSNQWILEVIASALAPSGLVVNRSSAQAWLRENGYVPSVIPIPAGRRAGARLFSPHVRFSDHSDDEWKEGRYAVVSVDSVAAFMKVADRGVTEFRVRAEPRRDVTGADSGRTLSPAPDQASSR